MNSFNRSLGSLDELTASELNDAIDDTNFPKAQSTSCSSKVDDTNHQNGNTSSHAANNKNGLLDDENRNADGEANENDSVNTTIATNGHKGFIKRTHPAPLKMVAFKGDSIDVPGTPRTPRTSTTPGNPKTLAFCVLIKSRNPLVYIQLAFVFPI